MTKALILFMLFILFYLNVPAQWIKGNGPYGGKVYSTCLIPDTSGNKVFFAGTEVGIYKSVNNNFNWEICNNGLPSSYYAKTEALLFSGDTLWAGTGDGVYYSNNLGADWYKAGTGLPNQYEVNSLVLFEGYLFAGVLGDGVYRSSNNGLTWEQVNAGFSYLYTYALMAKGSKIYAGIVHSGVYYSTNKGTSWIQANTGISDKDIVSLASLGSKIYAATGTGLFVSDNEGLSWNLINISGIITITAKDSNLFAGTEYGLYISSNGGSTWNLSSDGLMNSEIQSIGFNGNNIIVGTNGAGVFASTSMGISWENVSNGMQILGIQNILYNESYIYAATYGGGVFISNDGIKWKDINNGLLYCDVQALIYYKEKLYAGTSKGVFCTSNNGSSWREIDSGFTNKGLYIKSFASSDSNIYAGTTDGIFKTSDCGTIWHPIGLSNKQVNSIVIKDSSLFAATAYSGLFRSTDQGNNWQSINNGVFGLSIKSLSSYGSDLFAGSAGGFLRSMDNGNSWFSAGFIEDHEVYAMTYLNWNIFIGTLGNGVYASMNSGYMWNWVSDYMDVKSLCIIEEDLFAGTTTGVFKRNLKEITSIKDEEFTSNPNTTFLEQNYPNPFNPKTTIDYTIPSSSHVSIKIYNIMGKELVTLLNEVKDAGKHSLIFDAKGIPSGIYFYKLSIGNFTETRKLILLK